MNYRRLITLGLLLLAAILPITAFTIEVDEACLRRVIVQSLHHEGIEFSRPGSNVIHVVSSVGKTSFDRVGWVRAILNHANTPKDLQRWWTKQSQWGQVWTKNIAIPYYDPKTNVSIEFKIKPGYSFFDVNNPTHQTVWENWQKAHSQEPNAFSPEQVQGLKEMREFPDFPEKDKLAHLAVPDHSNFYAENHLVGLLVNGIPERGEELDCWDVVNFNGIEEIHIHIPDSIELPPDLQRDYVFKYEP